MAKVREKGSRVRKKGLAIILIIFIALCFTMGLNQVLAEDKTILELKLNEGSGIVVKDSSGYSNNGMINGATWVKGKFGVALEFDGEDDYVEIPDSDSLNTPKKQITIEAWVKPTGQSKNQWGHAIKRTSGAYSLGIIGTDTRWQIQTAMNVSGQLYGNTKCLYRRWHHIVVTYDGEKVILYLDGVKDAEKVTSGDIFNPRMNVRIGTWSKYRYKGLIGEIKIHTCALSSDEIASHYNMSKDKYVSVE